MNCGRMEERIGQTLQSRRCDLATARRCRWLQSLVAALLLFQLFQQPAAAQGTVAFYFAAHEDDWQLFMNPDAYDDVHSPTTKVVFVYVTAGDAGAGSGNAGRSRPYYLARENGAKLSVMFMADGERAPARDETSTATVFGHAVLRWAYRNTVSYFLRLPDGNMDGMGYEGTGWQSLQRLHQAELSSIEAVDGSAIYRGWNDLAATLRDVIANERRTAEAVWINIPDPDASRNGSDHSDHRHVAAAVLDAVADMPCINRALYLDYAAAGLAENLTTTEREVKAATFAATALGVNAFDHAGNWDTLHRRLLSRRYVQRIPAIPPCQDAVSRNRAPCGLGRGSLHSTELAPVSPHASVDSSPRND